MRYPLACHRMRLSHETSYCARRTLETSHAFNAAVIESCCIAYGGLTTRAWAIVTQRPHLLWWVLGQNVHEPLWTPGLPIAQGPHSRYQS